MAADGRNVYLVKIGPKSFVDGCQDTCKDKQSSLGPVAEAEIIQSKAVFSCLCKTGGDFLFLFTFKGNIQCAKQGIMSGVSHGMR